MPIEQQRRSFLTSLNSRVAAIAALAAGAAMAKDKTPKPWAPARHEQDDWLDKLPCKHRLVLDSTSADGFGEAVAFAGNYLRVNKADYGLEDSDLSVVIVARHRATPFAYNDAMWTKYGKEILPQAPVEDPKSDKPPSRGASVDALLKRGVQLAVCSTATRGIAGRIAKKIDGKQDDIFKELIANLLSNGRMVPAGIVAVSRAQEHGYTVVKA